MNLRMDDDIRIRLSRYEFEELSRQVAIERKFSLGSNIHFRLRLSMGTESRVLSEGTTLNIQLRASDLPNLIVPASIKNGLSVDGIVIQVDRFDK